MLGGSVNYCDKCSRIISPAEERDGLALVSSSSTLCSVCRKAADTNAADGFEIESEETHTKPKAQSQRTRASTVDRRPISIAAAPAPKANAVLLAGGFGGGALLAIILILALHAPAPTSPPVQAVTAPPDAPAPVAPRAPAQPARPVKPAINQDEVRERLDTVVVRIDPTLSQYASMRTELMGLLNEHLGTEIEGDIKSILSMLDGQYAALANAALAEGRERSMKIAEVGDFAAAIQVLRDIECRFPDGPWLPSRGSEEIASTVASITRMQQARRQQQQQQTTSQPPSAGSTASPPLEPLPEGWTAIFNSANTAGWITSNDGRLTVQDGELRSTDSSDMYFGAPWLNLDLISDVFISKTKSKHGAAAVIGLRAIGLSRGGLRIRIVFHNDGDIHVHADGKVAVQQLGSKSFPLGEWFRLRLVLSENMLETHVNGKLLRRNDVSEDPGQAGGVCVFPSVGVDFRLKNPRVKLLPR